MIEIEKGNIVFTKSKNFYVDEPFKYCSITKCLSFYVHTNWRNRGKRRADKNLYFYS